MPSLLFLLLALVIFVGAFGFMIYRHEADKRASETKQNHYHDRV
jgi:preprotein translocase subunit YajC